uniref:DDE_Tnp_ISL3 domain-containing protein n=1 Tax=Haemonchus contortus TaxID=6289 RepID=A0A7I4YIF1_HAECO
MTPRNEHHNGWACNRRSCRTGPTNETKVYFPARKGTFFYKSNLGESTVSALSYLWLHDTGKVKDKAYELHMNSRTVVQWEKCFRDVCAEYSRKNPPIIGGFGCDVEIDETLVTRPKYNRGRWVRRHQWLFGGIWWESGRAFLTLFWRKDASTLRVSSRST